MPATAHFSSFSDVSPEMPTAPMTSPASSRTSTPPITGTKRPSLAAASDGRFVPVTGGVLVRDAAGDVIGAVGISGDTSDNDEKCAVAGIAAAGLKADPGVDPT